MKFLFLFLISFSAFSQTEKFSATLKSKFVGTYKLDLFVSLPHTRDILVEQKTYVYLDDQYPQWACMIQARSLESLTWRANLGGKLFNGRSDLIYSISENLENEFQPCPLFFQEGQHPVSLTGVPYLRLEIEKGLFLTVSLYNGLWHGLADLTETTFNMELESLRTQSRRYRSHDVYFSVTKESMGSVSFLEHGEANFEI